MSILRKVSLFFYKYLLRPLEKSTAPKASKISNHNLPSPHHLKHRDHGDDPLSKVLFLHSNHYQNRPTQILRTMPESLGHQSHRYGGEASGNFVSIKLFFIHPLTPFGNYSLGYVNEVRLTIYRILDDELLELERGAIAAYHRCLIWISSCGV